MNQMYYLHSQIKNEKYPDLWTVGFDDPASKWQPVSDHNSEEDAAERVDYLNHPVTCVTEMTRERAIEELDRLSAHDPEASHFEADEIICKFLGYMDFDDVCEAFDKCKDRVGFWYA